MKNFIQQPTPVPPQVEIPQEFPDIPQTILDRFPEAVEWQRRLDEFWTRANQAIQQAQDQTAKQVNSNVVFNVDSFLIYANGVPTPMFSLDASGVRLGNVLVINTPGNKVYIGAGELANDNTPFYIDTLGNFSLGASLVWDPVADTLTITGIINATSGTIGGFTIGADFIRDSANSFGLASTVTGGNDVRFWAGATFANRTVAPLRIFESGFAVVHELSVEGNFGTSPNDAGLQVVGSYSSQFTSHAKGILNNPNLEAAGNNNILSAFRSDPGFTKGAFTGLTANGISLRMIDMAGAGTIDNAYGIYIDTISVGTNNYAIYAATTAANYLAGVTGVGVAPSTTTRLILAAGTTGLSSLRMPHGAAPTAPVDGDCWTTTAGIFVRINGATVGPLS